MLDSEPQVITERLLAIVREPAAVSNDLGRDVSFSVSIGIAYGLHETPETLLSDAQIAQSVAKASGKNQCVAFETTMLQEAQKDMQFYPHLAIFPGAAIALCVYSFNMFGDALRATLDPRLRTSR